MYLFCVVRDQYQNSNNMMKFHNESKGCRGEIVKWASQPKLLTKVTLIALFKAKYIFWSFKFDKNIMLVN